MFMRSQTIVWGGDHEFREGGGVDYFYKNGSILLIEFPSRDGLGKGRDRLTLGRGRDRLTPRLALSMLAQLKVMCHEYVCHFFLHQTT